MKIKRFELERVKVKQGILLQKEVDNKMFKNKDIDIVLAHNASQVALGNSPKIGDGDTKPSKVITA